MQSNWVMHSIHFTINSGLSSVRHMQLCTVAGQLDKFRQHTSCRYAKYLLKMTISQTWTQLGFIYVHGWERSNFCWPKQRHHSLCHVFKINKLEIIQWPIKQVYFIRVKTFLETRITLQVNKLQLEQRRNFFIVKCKWAGYHRKFQFIFFYSQKWQVNSLHNPEALRHI